MPNPLLESLSDADLQQLTQSGTVPMQFVQQEQMRRSTLRTSAEGASMAPEQFQGLGATGYGY